MPFNSTAGIIALIIALLSLTGYAFIRQDMRDARQGDITAGDPVDPEDHAPLGDGQAKESEILDTRIDQGASALGVKVVPLEVLEDSRCPMDVACIQAGTVRLRTILSSGLGEGEQIFKLNEPITTEAEMVTLVNVEPEPSSKRGDIRSEEYQFRFEVRKR